MILVFLNVFQESELVDPLEIRDAIASKHKQKKLVDCTVDLIYISLLSQRHFQPQIFWF